MQAELWGLPIGSWAELVSGAAGFAAVAITLVVTRSERDRSQRNIDAEREVLAAALQLERERWNTDRETRDRAQADRVGVVVVFNALLERNEVAIENASDVPISDVRLFALTPGLFREQPLGPTLRAHSGERATAPPALFGDLTNGGDRIGYTFRDNAGRYWARYVNGALVSLAGTDPDRILREPAPWPNHERST